ncbi:MAG: universal stress protein [Chloroflexi bacterium]|nr:universal stress protein [Chloroflexota bacterium]
MYDRIIVPLDGSPLAERVLPYVTRISLGMGIPVHLMQVFPSVSEALADPAHGRYQSGISAGAHDEAMDYLNSVKRKTAGVEITCEAHEGDIVTHIIDEAEKSPNSLVALSTHGRSGVTRWLMGSVTDNVLHHTKNPMLIFRGHQEGDPEPDTNLETIIVPLDGSPLAEQVLPHVVALAKALNLKVTLIRAAATVEEFSAVTGFQRVDGISGLHYQTFENLTKVAGNQALDYIKGQEEHLRSQGVASVDHRIVPGSAAAVIVDVALETPDNLVAMTTHGRSGPARWTLGNVTDRVVRHSGDPVLVVRTS